MAPKIGILMQQLQSFSANAETSHSKQRLAYYSLKSQIRPVLLYSAR